jgi:amino acid adenylation domain-containing protein
VSASIADFLDRLSRLGVQLTVDGDRLRCSAPRGVLTDALRTELASRKAEVLAWMQAQAERNGGGHGDAGAAGERVLSPAQQRLWFIDQMQPGNPAYNITVGLRLVGVLDIDALRACLAELTERHEALRTVYEAIDGHPVPVVQPAGGHDVPVIDLRAHPAKTREAEAERRFIEAGRQPFDLRHGPLTRSTLWQLADDTWIFQVGFHHIAGDGWAAMIIARELATLYMARVSGSPASLPPLATTYGEFIRRQSARRDAAALKRDDDYWKAQLTPPPPVLELPTDRPRPAVQTFDGARVRFMVGSETTEALKRVGRANGVTLFMVLLAAHGTLLHRYTGLDDIAVGVPIAGRTGVEAEALVGLFANTLVMRVDLRDDPTFPQLLHRVRDVALQAYAHQDMPFERLVSMVQPARDLSHSPLFQVMFTLQNLPLGKLALPALTVTHVNLGNGTAKTDLALEVLETDAGLELYLEYNTALFDVTTICRLGGHLCRLLEAVSEGCDAAISRVSLLTDEERRHILVDGNATAVPESAAMLPALLEAQARRTPAAPAVSSGDTRASYAELLQSADGLARRLRRLGVGRDVLVGILMNRSVDMVVAMLGVLRAGGAYVPLDPAFPRDRLEFMLSDAAIRVIVTEAPMPVDLTLADGTTLVTLDADSAADVAGAPLPAPAPGDLAYVIYTSGSTGRPKGVQIEHRSLVNLLEFFRGALQAGAHDVLLAVTTLSFDIAGLELLMPLIAGAHVVVASRAAAVDAAKLMVLQDEHPVTLMQATPATWRMLLDAGWAPRPGLKVLCGGEALAPELGRRLLATGVRLWNVYGPTETTIWSTMQELRALDGPVGIGRPIANTSVYVLDAQGSPVPIGVPGELYIGGVGVARGYLNRPELTAERFVPDPFGGKGGRLYRTGDLVRLRADGTLEFLGRLDHQVKIRGFRIELGEIEAVLGQMPGITEAVAIAREDRPGDRALAAYLRTDGGSVSAEACRAFLRQQLPEYMVPASFTVLAEFPLTPNGKVDRRRLPAPAPQARVARRGPQRNGNGVERILADVWREALRVEDVDVDDNFFDIGGHSLLLVQVQARLRAVLQREVAIVEMFQFPTIRALAGHLAVEPALSGATT